MKIRLEKAEGGVPLAQIPIGHVAQYQGIDKGCSAKVLRTHLGAVNLDGWGYFVLRDRHAKDRDYIDLGPLGAVQEKPKRVPFAEIQVGHVARGKYTLWFVCETGGIIIGGPNEIGKHVDAGDFTGSYEDLGKLVIEP